MTTMTATASSQGKMQVNSRNLDSLSRFYPVPLYNRDALQAGVLHMSLGGFHRAHQAVYFDDYLNACPENWMISAVGLLPQDAGNIEALNSQDTLYSVLQRSPDADEPRIIGGKAKPVSGRVVTGAHQW